MIAFTLPDICAWCGVTIDYSLHWVCYYCWVFTCLCPNSTFVTCCSGIGLNLSTENLIQSIAAALHMGNQPVVGQSQSAAKFIKNPTVHINTNQPLVQVRIVRYQPYNCTHQHQPNSSTHLGSFFCAQAIGNSIDGSLSDCSFIVHCKLEISDTACGLRCSGSIQWLQSKTTVTAYQFERNIWTMSLSESAIERTCA